MINKQFGLKLSALTMAVMLAGCGGGDGYYGSSGSGATPGEPGVEQPGVSSLNTTNVSLKDTSDKAITALTALGGIASVTVTNQKGEPVHGALVTFTTNANLEFGTSNNAVLTDAAGVASISVKPKDSTTTGAYTISASVSAQGLTAQTSETAFSIQPVKTVADNLKAAVSTLEAGGKTNITLVLKNPETGTVQNNLPVNFSASCGSFDASTVNSTNQGNVIATYQAIDDQGHLCTGPVVVTVSTASGVLGTVNLTVNTVKPNSILYSSDPVKLGAVTSGTSSSGQIEFTIFADEQPAPDQEVKVELKQGPADLTFVTLGNTDSQTLRTDAAGKIYVNVYPGSLPGPVEIKATLVADSTISALSKDVSVATGRATQEGMSLSIDKQALQNSRDGDEANITVRLADRVGNKVPDGTVVSFISEGGSVDPNCSTINGACSVTLITQDPRPADNRVTVLAFVEGDKAYIDTNSDNRYTPGVDKLKHNIGQFFRDDNENNLFESHLGEFLYPRMPIGDSAECAASTVKTPNIAGTCDTGLSAVLREQIIFAFSHNTPTISDVALNGSSFSFNMFGNNLRTVPMPTNTTVSVAAEDKTPANAKSCSVKWLSGDETVRATFNMDIDALRNGGVRYNYGMTDCDIDDNVVLTVTAPDGKVSKISYVIK